MSFRTWLSIITLVLIGLVIFFAREDLVLAWHELGNANIWILLLIVPAVLLGHIAAGEMMFSYLRHKDKSLGVGAVKSARLSMELNFVNHVLPSGGVSGLSYMTWRLGTLGVSPGRSALAQMVRFAMQFTAFVVLLLVAVISMALMGLANRYIVLLSIGMAILVIGVLVGVIFLLNNDLRIKKFSYGATRFVNWLVRFVSFGKVPEVLGRKIVESFLNELQDDYQVLKREKRHLGVPLIWGFVSNIADVSVFFLAFWALGAITNPAPIFIAYGLSSISGVFVATPGGAGAYEAIMISFMSLAGVAGSISIAAVLLGRIILMLITIGAGYFVYQHALITYGRKKR